MSKVLPLLIAALLMAGFALLIWMPPRPAPPRAYADLGSAPDWTELDAYAGTMTRAEFEALLAGPFTLGDRWKEFFEISDAAVRTRTEDGWHELPLAPPGGESPPPRYWRPAAAMPPAPAGRPLEGVRIAIDPGHLGGSFAVMEERWYKLGAREPVTEGDMTLRVAKLLEPRLAALGAEVTLVRDAPGPVTARSAREFRKYARHRLRTGTPAEVRGFAERLFYRTAEIRERARLVNEEIRPDLVLCLHFNAEAWGDPRDPELLDRNHFHVLLNGSYTPGEIALHDERFEMLLKILQGIHAEEKALGTVVAAALAEESALPPYVYKAEASAQPVPGSPYLWTRNLLANRLYRCPVVFLEPYVMNDRIVFERIQAGDYEGTRPVAGKERKSIYREYADGVAEGLRAYYAANRTRPAAP
ncbi:MAG: hypothetical protein HKN82_13835 [Akkermansiaceae bacterium]|nr:hypothetical protein [Akkermansiaceae bacterium]NNM31224.1 hypothetical protein [Akkermansiaceae bacterium]